jgi:hypothetical protein
VTSASLIAAGAKIALRAALYRVRLPLFSDGRAARAPALARHRRLRGATPSRLTDLGARAPHLGCDIPCRNLLLALRFRFAWRCTQYGLPLFGNLRLT